MITPAGAPRIVPAYWVALTVLSIYPGLPDMFSGHWWVYYGFGQDYAGIRVLGGIDSAWTLGCEVAFYALLPFLSIAFDWAATRLAGRRVSWRLEVAALAVLCLMSATYRSFANAHKNMLWFNSFLATFAWFAVGMLLALASVAWSARDSPRLRTAQRYAWLGWPAALAFYVLLCLGLTYTNGNPFFEHDSTVHVLLWYALNGIVAACLVLPAVFESGRQTVVVRVLSWRLLAWIGLISYGIYLYHNRLLVWVDSAGVAGGDRWLRLVWLCAATLAAAVIAASLSYYLVERPVLRFKERPWSAPAARLRAQVERRPALHLHVTVIVGLLAVSVLAWSNVWLAGDPGSTLTCQCGDPALSLWYVDWLPWSIAHLHNPFFSQAIYAGQGGVNTLETTSLGPSLLVWPVTAIFGPIAGFNVLVTVVPVINGWSMFVLLRKVTRFLPGQLIGAALYGFSPYVIGNVRFGDFNADLVFFAPLALWCLYDLLVDRRHSSVAVGIALGVLGVVQFFVGPELLATGVLMALLAGIITLLVGRRLLWERRAALVRGLGVAGAIWLVVLAYPAWYLLDGPRHIVGVPWPATAVLGVGWSWLVDPGPYSTVLPSTRIAGYAGAVGPNASYLGIALVAALALTAVLWRRRRLAVVVAGAGVIAWTLSTGRGGYGSRWRPWRIFDQLPVLSKALPGRFAVYVDLAAAVLVAVVLDLAWSRRERVVAYFGPRVRAPRRRLELCWGALCCAGAVAVLIPIFATYELPYVIEDQPAPQWFTEVSPTLRPWTVLLTLPYATPASANAMAWQAEADFRFRIVGGYAQVPGRGGHSQMVDPPGGAQAPLRALSFFGYGPEPVYSPAQGRLLRAALARWGVQEVVATGLGRDPSYAVHYLTMVLGRPPAFEDGSWVWTRVAASASGP